MTSCAQGPLRRATQMRVVFLFRRRAGRVLLLALVLSALMHFIAGPLLYALFGYRPLATTRFSRPLLLTISSARRRAPQAKPVLPPRPVQPARLPPRPVPAPQPPAHRELARVVPARATPEPRRAERHAAGITPAQIARDESRFEMTIAQARTAQNPVTSAARASVAPQAPRAYAFNLNGARQSPNEGEGILTPVKSWHLDGYDYYYLSYWVRYASGAEERGIVPWPVRYPPNADPFTDGHSHSIPLPKPLPDYVPPPGTQMPPLVAYCYDHRFMLQSCPPRRSSE